MPYRSARAVRGFACLAVCGLIWSGAAQAQDSQPSGSRVLTVGGQQVRVVTTPGFTFPWSIAFLPNGDQLVSEKDKSTLAKSNGYAQRR
jgi:hypothetical protein